MPLTTGEAARVVRPIGRFLECQIPARCLLIHIGAGQFYFGQLGPGQGTLMMRVLPGPTHREADMKRHHTRTPAGAHSGHRTNMAIFRQALQVLLNPRKHRVLQMAQAALPEFQFKAFRKLFLDEFGGNGLESDLLQWLGDIAPSPDRIGQEYPSREGGAIMRARTPDP